MHRLEASSHPCCLTGAKEQAGITPLGKQKANEAELNAQPAKRLKCSLPSPDGSQPRWSAPAEPNAHPSAEAKAELRQPVAQSTADLQQSAAARMPSCEAQTQDSAETKAQEVDGGGAKADEVNGGETKADEVKGDGVKADQVKGDGAKQEDADKAALAARRRFRDKGRVSFTHTLIPSCTALGAS